MNDSVFNVEQVPESIQFQRLVTFDGGQSCNPVNWHSTGWSSALLLRPFNARRSTYVGDQYGAAMPRQHGTPLRLRYTNLNVSDVTMHAGRHYIQRRSRSGWGQTRSTVDTDGADDASGDREWMDGFRGYAYSPGGGHRTHTCVRASSAVIEQRIYLLQCPRHQRLRG